MPIVSHVYSFVVGVDSHARNNALAIITPTGELIASDQFPTSVNGLTRALAWVRRRTKDSTDVLWVIEGVATYGAGMARIAGTEFKVVEAARMNARANNSRGKSDPLDARRIAAAVLPLKISELRIPRQDDGVRAAVRITLTARKMMSKDRTECINALTALLRNTDLGLDARKPLTPPQITTVSRWRRREEDTGRRHARAEAVRLATRILELDEQLAVNHTTLAELLEHSPAVVLLDEYGIGPVVAGRILAAWSHQGRLQSEAAWASLAGVNPIPASSGNTVRHRLNRAGDRQLNAALHTVALTRARGHTPTRQYIERRRAEGKTDREIRRCLKRYIARQVYRLLNTADPQPALSTS